MGRLVEETGPQGFPGRGRPGFWGGCENLGRARATSLYLRRGQLVPGGRGIQVSLAIPEEGEEKKPPKQVKQTQAPFLGKGCRLCKCLWL